MMPLLAFSGVRSAGKTTSRNFVVGSKLVKAGVVPEFDLTPEGDLILPTEIEGEVKMSPVAINMPMFMGHPWIVQSMYPHVRHFSFAHELRIFAFQYLHIDEKLLWGDYDSKKKDTQYQWEQMPFYSKKNYGGKTGPMSVRDVLEQVGNVIMSHINPQVWISLCLGAVEQHLIEKPDCLCVIDDLRKAEEFEAVKKLGGRVIRLDRDLFNEPLASEVTMTKEAFDYSKFDAVIPDGNIAEVNSKIKDLLVEWNLL